MKSGETRYVAFKLEIDKPYEEVRFRLSNGKTTITKSTKQDVVDSEGVFLIPLQQTDTSSLVGSVTIEAEIDYRDGSVIYSDDIHLYINDSLGWAQVTGSHPSEDDGIEPILTAIQTGVAVIVNPEASQELIDAVTELFQDTKAIAQSVRDDADNGEFDGFSPQVTVKTETPSTYVLHIKDADHEFDTPNLQGQGEGGTSDYEDLENKPRINNTELIGNKTDTDLGLATKTELNAKQNVITGGNGIDVSSDVVSVDLLNGESVLGFSNGKLKSDLSAYYTKTESDNRYNAKLTVGNGIDISNDTVSVDLSNKNDILQFDNGKLWLSARYLGQDIYVRSFLTDTSADYPLTSKSYVDTELAKKQDKLTAGTNITIDSNNVISASGGGLSYTFTDGLAESSGTVGIDLKSGTELQITNDQLDIDLSGYATTTDLADKQDTIDSTHKLDADNVDDSNSSNKFVTATDKQTWNAKADTSDIPTNVSELQNDSGYQTSADVQTAIADKEDKTDISTDTTSTTDTLDLLDNTEQRYTQELSALTLTLPLTLDDDFISSVVFKSGSTATQMTYDSSIKWSGDDVTNGQFVPTEKTYNIVMWYDGINVNGVVRGV